MPILGGSPLGLIGVSAGPSRDGMSTFNGGVTRNLNVNLYNAGREADKAKLKKAGLSTKSGMFSVFSGGAAVSPWGNIKTTGKEENAGLGLEGDYNGVTRTNLHNNDVYDTSILNIVEKTAGSAAALRPSDFAYLKNLGVYPNNRLIVCRRFAGPQIDNIYGIKSNPIVVLITWCPPGTDFFEITFNEEWEAAKADFTDVINGIGEDILKMSPLGQAGGEMFGAIPLPGFSETITRIVLAKIGVYEQNAGGNRLPAGNPNLIKDAKRRKTIAMGEPGSGLGCKFTVKVTVEYEQKFISGIDPTIVYMDIIQNALRFGTSPSDNYGLSGGFGATIIAAVKNPKLLLNAVIKILKDAITTVKETVMNFFKGFVADAEAEKKEAGDAKFRAENNQADPPDPEVDKNGKPIPKVPDLAAATKEFDEKTKAAKDATEGLGLFETFFNTIGSALSKTINKYEEAVKGIVYALTGLASTPWHVTIGNPLRPIFCSGDMLCDAVTLTFGSTLAFNDLPANIKLDFNLSNARPWGLQEILARFNTGNVRTVNLVKDSSGLNPQDILSQNAYHYSTQSVPGGETTGTGTTPSGPSTPATNPSAATNDVVSKEGVASNTVNSDPNSTAPVLEGTTTNNITATLVGEVTYLDLADSGVRASATYLINNIKEVSGIGEAPFDGSTRDVRKQIAAELAKQNAIKNYK
jgi:hypothetical protein